MSGIKSVFGGGGISHAPFGSSQALEPLFALLESEGVKTIDTAQIYGDSEKLLGGAKAGTRFTLDTKHAGGAKPGNTRADLVKWAKESIERLQVDKVNCFYIHAPDPTTAISETLAGIDEVHKLGLFERFGLSNFTAEGVEEVYAHCKEHGYVLPSVYQGNYSAVARRYETLLFPTLRKLNIAFYAYSPLAGGFLTKTRQQILDGAGRFSEESIGGLYRRMYNKPSYLDALAEWEQAAKEAGCSRSDLAYRWVKYSSPLSAEHGDAVIIGSRNLEQLKETLDGLKAGPLPAKSLERIEAIWKTVEHEAPLDNFSYVK